MKRLSVASKAHLFAWFAAWCIFAVHMPDANAEPAFSWEQLCAVSVCRGTGHDGVFAVAFSPDNKQLLVEVLHPQKSGIFLVGLAGEATFLSEGRSASWMPDGKRLIYLHDGDLWSTDVSRQKTMRLTEGWNDMRAPKPSPTGDWVVFASNRSGHQDLWLVPADGSAVPVQLTNQSLPADELRFGFSWSPDGKQVAYFSNQNAYWSDDLWVIDVETKKQKQLTSTVMGRGAPTWSPDGSQVAIYGTLKTDYWYNELADVFVVDVQAATTRKLTKQITARETAPLNWSPDGKRIFFHNHSRGEMDLWSVPSEGGVATRMTHEGGFLHNLDMSPDGETFALIRSTPTRGREIDLLPAMGGTAARLTHFSTAWQGLTEPQEISYRSVDGMYMQGFMFRPPGFRADQKYPTIIQVHGGGTHSYYNGLNLVEQRLAQLGYVVIAVNYRGGSGFGRRFQDLSTNDWANTQALDAAAAADFVRAQPWSNSKVGIYGYSYGGITSLAAVTRAPEAFDAAVPMAGIYDFATAYNNDNRLIKLFIRYGHSGEPEEQPGHYDISNSVKKLKDVKTPILLMHGESDSIAPFGQFKQATTALKRHGKVFEAHSYPGEPHRFRKPENRADMYRRLEVWMARWLKSE